MAHMHLSLFTLCFRLLVCGLVKVARDEMYYCLSAIVHSHSWY